VSSWPVLGRPLPLPTTPT